MNIEQLYARVYNWLLNTGPKVLAAVVILIIGQWLVRQARRLTARAMERKNFSPSLRPFFLNFMYAVLQVLLILAVLQIMGIQMTIFATVLGALGVAAGLALSGTLQNFTSGIMILLFKPFRTGDNIMAQGMEGKVINIEIFHTVVKAHDNKIIIIPNSKLSNDIIVNLSREGKRRLDIEFKVPFNVNFRDAQNILEQAAFATGQVLKDPVPRTGISSIENDGYKIILNAWLPAHGYYDTKLALQIKLVEDLKNGGIKLPGM